MRELTRNKPVAYVKVSFAGEPPPVGLGARILYNVDPPLPQRPDGQRGWMVTEPCPEKVRVKFLAMVLNVEPFKVVADLLNLGISPSTEQTVPFEKALELLRHHGYTIREV
ncbi:MAG TPA: hypothetical protein VL361_23600 [Candidatus Limnocylindrales bacterium]|nr:hypothetical protein [Candidatus Limnocylindrales bacterium]